MKQLNITIPENTYVLSNSEIELIHAMSFYFASTPKSSGMTKKAHSLVCKLEEQFRMHEAIGSFQVWD